MFFIICSTNVLHQFFEELNQLNQRGIKFTMSHTSIPGEPHESRCNCPSQDSIPFLDTSCKIEKGKIIFDLYRKESDRNMYLLPDSCHAPNVQTNIPFSLALRITRICSHIHSREQRFSELKQLLLDRNYREGMIDAALAKARLIPRKEALKKVVKTNNLRRPVFAVSWDPRLPSIDAVQQKHWRAMVALDPYLKEVFPQPLWWHTGETQILESSV